MDADVDADAQAFNAEGRRTRGTRRNAEKVVLEEGKGPTTTQVGIEVSNAKAQRCKERKERKGDCCFFFIALRPLQLGVFALEAN